MATETLTFDLLARDHASGAFKKIARSSDDVHRKFGFLATRTKHLTAGIRSGFGLVAGAMGSVAAISVFKNFIDEARDSQRVTRLTSAAIKSTGGAAHVTAKQVSDLASSISNMTGKDDEAIQAGQNMLLTFTNIRNATGKNNDIFNRASQTLVDMTAALNGGRITQENMRKQAIQLGKALNDPIKGITALRRVGVSFTDQQTEQIKKLVESGKTLDAQKIILRELGREFGGAAKATSDPLERLRVIVDNLSEQIGTALLPVINQFANWLGTKAAPAVALFIEQMQSGKGTGGQFADVLLTIKDVLETLFGAIKATVEWMIRWHKIVVPLVAVLGTFAATLLTISKVFTIVTAAARIFGITLTLSLGPVSLIIAAIAALAVGLVYAYKKSETFRKIVNTVFKAVANVVLTYIKIVLNIFKAMVTAWLTAVGIIIKGAAMAFGWVPGVGGKLKKAAKAFDKFSRGVTDGFDKVIDKVDAMQRRINRTHGKDVKVTVEMQMKNRLKIAAQQGVALTITGKPIPLATGGRVRGPGGPTGDKIPAMLSDGEYVIKASRARQLGTRFLDMLNGAKSVGGDPGAVVLRFASGGSVAAAQSFVRAQKGERYVLGGAGPDVWDCSGITGAAYALLKGLGYGAGQRYFTTQSNFGALGFKRGLGAYTIGVSPAAGHMVGNIGGLSFEAARPGVPLRVGNATSVKSMAQQWFLASLGGAFGSMGSVRLDNSDLRKIMKAIGIHWGVRTGVPLTSFDRGGWLHPGATLAINNTGRPERILPPGADGGVVINGDIHLHGVQNVNQLMQEITRRSKKGPGWRVKVVPIS